MAVKPYPKKNIEDFINKGASVTTEKEKDVQVMINLRMPKSLLNEIDGVKPIGISRNAWIVLAIHNELKGK